MKLLISFTFSKYFHISKVMFEAYELDFTKKGDEIGQ